MKNILVVDDNEEMLDAMEILISHFGFNVTVATSYHSLIKAIEDYIPDAILLDVVLGPEDGRQICKKLKSEQRTANVFIILISGQPDVLINYKEFKADAVLHKPFDIEKFKQLINRFEKIIYEREN